MENDIYFFKYFFRPSQKYFLSHICFFLDSHKSESLPQTQEDTQTDGRFMEFESTSLTNLVTSSTDAEPDKRKIHKCDFPTCDKVYTKSSHLKAHKR